LEQLTYLLTYLLTASLKSGARFWRAPDSIKLTEIAARKSAKLPFPEFLRSVPGTKRLIDQDLTVFVNVEPVGDIMVLNDLFTRTFHLYKSDEYHKLNAFFVYTNLCIKFN
jgi:hypothetical protein